jgi:uncharacterized protein (TIGR02466 family)
MSEVELSGLFPVPFMRVQGQLDDEWVASLLESFDDSDNERNVHDRLLSHTSVLDPESDPVFSEISALVRPRLVQFGALMFGEDLDWFVKEMWMNRLEHGGQQSIHSHANSFISGVIYLTRSHPSARTVFYRGMGGRDFAFANEHHGTRTGPFNAPKWAVPEPAPGDMVLFPSYLLHEVPRNEGETRVTVAFNAVPRRLRSWDYELRFSS